MYATRHFQDLLVDATKRETEMYLYHMKKIFREMDARNTGEIVCDDFQQFILHEETGPLLQSYDVVTRNGLMLFELLDEMDDNPDGTIDLPSFVIGMQHLCGSARSMDLAMLHREFIHHAETVTKLLKQIQETQSFSV